MSFFCEELSNHQMQYARGRMYGQPRTLSVPIIITGPDVPTMQKTPVVTGLGSVIPDLCLPTVLCPEPNTAMDPATENRWVFAELKGEA